MVDFQPATLITGGWDYSPVDETLKGMPDPVEPAREGLQATFS